MSRGAHRDKLDAERIETRAGPTAAGRQPEFVEPDDVPGRVSAPQVRNLADRVNEGGKLVGQLTCRILLGAIQDFRA